MNILKTIFSPKPTIHDAYRLPVREENLPVNDVTAFADSIDLSSLEVITWTPAFMSRAERLLLYTLIFTLRPLRYLEIGTFRGGSALITTAAMDALNTEGRLVCIDPKPQILPENWRKIEHRATLIEGYSPDVLPEAVEAANGPFDFVFIDGDHTADGVLRDANGVLPYVTDNAYLLFHDSFFPKVAQSLQKFGSEHADEIVDFGSLTREVTVNLNTEGNPTRWGGLRMMQVRRQI